MARGLLVYDLTDGSSLWVGVVTFGAMIPRVLVPPFTGYLADRFNRRNIMASMFAINLVHNIALAALVSLDMFTEWSDIMILPTVSLKPARPVVPVVRERVGARGADAGGPGAHPEPGAARTAAERHRPEPGDDERHAADRSAGDSAAPADMGRGGRVHTLLRLLPDKPHTSAENQDVFDRNHRPQAEFHKQPAGEA